MKIVLKIGRQKYSILRDHFEGRSAITDFFHDAGIPSHSMDDFAGGVHGMGSFARTMDDSIAIFHDMGRSCLFRGITLFRFP